MNYVNVEKFVFLQKLQVVAQKELSILIVEDDLSFAIELEMLVTETGYRLHGRVDNSAEALEIILMDIPDLILMDVNIKGRMSGVEIAEKIAHLEIPILFITSFRDEDTYRRAQQTGAVGYVVKPIDIYTLRTAVSSVLKALSKRQIEINGQPALASQDTLYFKRRNVYEKLAIPQIQYIKANGDYTHVYGDQAEEYIASSRLSEFKALLPADQFLQIHRSFVVNTAHITSVEGSGSHLWVGDTMLPISRRLKKEVMARINLIR